MRKTDGGDNFKVTVDHRPLTEEKDERNGTEGA